MKALLLLALVSFSTLAGTINLSLDGDPYCATQQNGNVFTGVVRGVCESPTPPPAGRYTRGIVQYGPYTGAQTTADLTQWLWSKASVSDAPRARPGVNGSHAEILTLPKNGYVAMQFKTDSAVRSGFFSTIPDNRVPAYDICISIRPGDFGPTSAGAGACKFGALADGNVSLSWRRGLLFNNSQANLAADTTYYVNIRFSHPGSITTPFAPIKLTHNF